MSGRVVLYAYNILGSVGSTSDATIPAEPSLDGRSLAWHLSIVVFGVEVSYGADGITIVEYTGTPIETVFMGSTGRTKQQFLQFAVGLKSSWHEGNYNVLTHNCIHFVKEIVDFLQIDNAIPDRYLKDLETAQMVATGTGLGLVVGAILGLGVRS